MMTATDGTIWLREGYFPSQFGQGWPLIDETLSAMRERGWSEPEIFGVNLSIVEAVTNAIKHGNRNDANKNYYLKSEVTPSEIRVTVRDEGDGFDFTLIHNPLENENLEFPSGRGIFLMRQFMNDVHFNNSGTELSMMKTRNSSVGGGRCTN